MTKYAGKKPYPFKEGDNTTGQCSACGEAFVGEVAFDRHRHDVGNDRVCLDPASIETKPGGKFWWLDNRDRWHYSRPMTDEEKARVGRSAAPATSADRVGPETPRTAFPGASGSPGSQGRTATATRSARPGHGGDG